MHLCQTYFCYHWQSPKTVAKTVSLIVLKKNSWIFVVFLPATIAAHSVIDAGICDFEQTSGHCIAQVTSGSAESTRT